MDHIVDDAYRFLRENEGVTAIEYALIAALIAIVIIGAVTSTGTSLQAIFNYLSGQLVT